MSKFNLGDIVLVKATKEFATIDDVSTTSMGRIMYNVRGSSFDINYPFNEDELSGPEEVSKSEKSALRYNSGKPKLSMIDPEVLNLTADVLEFGSRKYSKNNWKKGLEISEVTDSLLRHAFAFASGEDNDPESGISHIGHIVCNAMFIAYYQKNNGKDER